MKTDSMNQRMKRKDKNIETSKKERKKERNEENDGKERKEDTRIK